MFVYESKYFKNGDKVRVKQEYYNDPSYISHFADPFAEVPPMEYKNVIFTVDIIDTRNDEVLILGQNENGKRGAWVPCHSVEKVNKVFNGLEE